MKNITLRRLLLSLALALWASAVFGQLKSGVNAPHCAFTGTMEIGDTLFFNSLDTALSNQNLNYQWYRINDDTGTGRQAISGATANSYILQEADSGKYIQLGVTPQGGGFMGTEIRSAILGKVYEQLGFFLNRPGIVAPYAFKLRPEDIPSSSPFQLNTQSLGLLIPQIAGAYPNGDSVFLYGVIQPKEVDPSKRTYGFYSENFNQLFEFSLAFYTKSAIDPNYKKVLELSGDINYAGSGNYQNGDPINHIGMTCSSLNFSNLVASNSTIGVVNTFLLGFKLNLASVGIVTALNDDLQNKRFEVPVKVRDYDFGQFDIEDLAGLRFMDLFLYDMHFHLVNDIDASETKNWNNGKGWQPLYSRFINSSVSSILNTSAAPNSIYFYPDSHKISGLYINRPNEDYVGLFSRVDYPVSNLEMLDFDITGKDYVGAIAGVQESPGDNSQIALGGNISGDSHVGASFGAYNSPSPGDLKLHQVYSTAKVEASVSNAGAFIGSANQSVSTHETYFNRSGLNGNVFVDPTVGFNDSVSYYNSDSVSNSTQGIGLTTSQMFNPANYITWDFNNDWARSSFLNDGYPVLRQFFDSLQAEIIVLDNPQCTGDSSGLVEMNIFGGTPPFNVLWDNGDSTAQSAGRSSGMVSAWVFDALGDSIEVSLNLMNVDSEAPEISLDQVYTLYSNSNGDAQLDIADFNNLVTDNCALDSIWLSLDSINCSNTATSRFASAIPFNGNSVSATVPNHPDFNFSTGIISMWVKPNTYNANLAIVAIRGANSRFSFHLNQANGEIGLWNNSSFQVLKKTDGFTAGEWYHLSFVLDPAKGNPQVWVNGDSLGTFSNNINTAFNNEDFRIGFSGGGEYFSGEIAQVAVFDSLLSANDFENLGSLAWLAEMPNLLAYYPMIDANTTLKDYGPNGFDGSYSGIDPATARIDYAPKLSLFAQDETGNTDSASAFLVLLDTIAPQFTNCPSDIVMNPDTAGCGAVVNYSLPTASDNCSIGTPQLISGYASGARFPAGITEVIYEVRDNSGNLSQCSFTVEIQDTVKPQAICSTSDTTVIVSNSYRCSEYFFYDYPEFTEDCQNFEDRDLRQANGSYPSNSWDFTGSAPTYYVREYDLVANGITSDYFLEDVSFGQRNGVVGEVYRVNIYLRTDVGNSNITSYSAPISNGRPLFHSATDTVEYGGTRLERIAINRTIPAGSSIILELVSPGRQFSVGGGQENDQTAPVWLSSVGRRYSVAGRSIFLGMEGAEVKGQITERVSGLASGALFPVGENVVKYRRSDASGNQDSCSFTLTVTDTNAPFNYHSTYNFDLTEDDTTNCGKRTNYALSPLIVLSDACGIDTVIQVGGLPLDTIFPIGTTVNSFIAYDPSGNVSDTATITVIINDRISPSPVLRDTLDLYLDQEGMVNLLGSDADLGSYDNCNGIDTITSSFNSFSCADVNGFSNTDPGMGYLSFDGVDDFVDISPYLPSKDTFSIEFWYRDVLADSVYGVYPDYFYGGGLFSLLSDTNQVVSLGGGHQYMVSYTNNYSFAYYGNTQQREWKKFRMVFSQGLIRTYINDQANSYLYLGSTTLDSNYNILLGKAEESGYAGYISEYFKGDMDDLRIWDTLAFPGEEHLYEDHLVVHYDFEEKQGDQLINRVNNQVEGQLMNMNVDSAWTSSQNKVPFVVSDQYGNEASDIVTVMIHDTIAPVIYSSSHNFYLDSNGFATVNYGDIIDSTLEACGLDTVIWSRDSLSCADLGTLAITITAQDINDNEAQETVMVEVWDTIAPLALAKSNTQLYLNANGSASLSVSHIDSGSYDPNCSLDTLYLSKTDFNCADLGMQEAYLIAKDAGGNIDSAHIALEIIDSLAPTVLVQNINLYLDANGQASISSSDLDNGSGDNCGTPSLDISKANFSCGDLGANSVWLYAMDASGNVDSAEAQVMLLDTIRPQAQAISPSLYLDANGFATISPLSLNNGSSDNCSSLSFSLSDTSFTCADLGNNALYFKVEDSSGNSDSVLINLTVIDSIRPNAQARNITLYLDQNGTASLNVNQVNLASAGNCPVNASISQSIFTCADEGLNLETLTVSDDGGNSDSTTFLVEVRDTIRPSVIAKNITVQLGATGQVSIAASQLDSASSDNCSNQLFFSVSKSSFNCANLGFNTVSLTATDGQGNSTTKSAQILVEDNILPIARVLNQTIYLDANGLASISASYVDNGSSDNCSIDSLAISKTNFNCSDLGTNTLQFSVFDQSGNENSTNVVITVVDTIRPQLSTQSLNVYLDQNGAATLSASQIDNGSSDNCSLSSISISKTNFDCSDLGMQQITFTATDASANRRSETVSIQVLDTISPQVPGGNLSISLDANGMTSLSPSMLNANASDNCSIQNWTLSKTSFDCSDLGANTVTLTATDLSGNSTATLWTITVEDNIAPTVLVQNISLYLDANGHASLAPSDVDAGSSDNCSIQNWTLSQSSFDCSNIGANVLSLSAEDASGNSNSASFVATVLDTMAPVLNLQSINVYLDANGQASISANDLDNGSSDNCAIQDMNLSANNFDCSDLGTQSISFTAIDVNGNSRSQQVAVQVLDTISPTIPGGSITISLDANGMASINTSMLNANAGDNCGVSTWSLSNTSFSCADVGANTVQLSATDASGNSQSGNYMVMVEDNLAPVLNTQNITVYLNANGMRAVLPTEVDNGSLDNCMISAFSLDIDTFDCADLGQNLVNFTATDVNGNQASKNVIITVLDTISPSISNLPANITAYAPAGSCDAIVQWPSILGADNCGNTTISTSQANGGLYSKGTSTVNVMVMDANGNSSSASFTVTVLDTISPIISNAPQVFNINPNANSCDAIVTWNPPVASDNCGVSTFTSNFSPGATLPIGTSTVVYTATDADGNSSSLSFDITVSDQISPQISNVPNTITQANDPGQCGANVSWSLPQESDNCTVSSFTASHNPGDFFPVGSTTVTYTAIDAAGNQTSASFDVIVEDNELPVVSTVPANDTVGQCFAAYNYNLPVATDNCSGLSIQQISGLPSGNVFPIGITQNTFRISDAAGNDTVVGFTVVVIPQGQAELPDLLEICANAPAVDISEGQSNIVWTGPGVNANVFTPANAGTGRKTLSYTYTDEYGCSASGSIIVTVLPVPASPVIVQVASNTLSTTQTYSTYQWYRDGVLIPGAINQNYSYSRSGNYQVMVGNISGCSLYGAGYAIGPINGGIGIEEFDWASMAVYPNPNNGLFTLDCTGLEDERLQVQVIATDGRVVYDSSRKLNAEGKMEIDLRGMAKAVYYLRVNGDQGFATRKLIIE